MRNSMVQLNLFSCRPADKCVGSTTQRLDNSRRIGLLTHLTYWGLIGSCVGSGNPTELGQLCEHLWWAYDCEVLTFYWYRAWEWTNHSVLVTSERLFAGPTGQVIKTGGRGLLVASLMKIMTKIVFQIPVDPEAKFTIQSIKEQSRHFLLV